MSPTYRVVGVGFDHMHIGDQLALAIAHSSAEVVGAYDSNPLRAQKVLDDLELPIAPDTNLERLIADTRPDIAFVCSTTAEHPRVVETLARGGVHMIVEKPMADSNTAAESMVESATRAGVVLAMNWPLAWVPSHRTCRRLVAEGAIGRIEQIHFYDGNRGPLFHSHGKAELNPSTAEKAVSWWYQSSAGGGSLRDYLGYGTTIASWFRDGELPNKITAAWHIPDGLEVDEQAVVIGHYRDGLSVFETRWGTHTDPWTLQPQPHCGFVVNGTIGSISSWDYDDGVTLHRNGAAERIPNDAVKAEDESALANLIAHLETGRLLDGPMQSQMSLAGHRLIEAAVESAKTEKSVKIWRTIS